MVRDIMRGLRRFRGDAAAVEKVLARLLKKRLGRGCPTITVATRGGPLRSSNFFHVAMATKIPPSPAKRELCHRRQRREPEPLAKASKGQIRTQPPTAAGQTKRLGRTRVYKSLLRPALQS